MRTVTVEITLYTFDELSDRAKKRALVQLRGAAEINDYWSEPTIEDAKQIAVHLGFEVDQVYWSGFGSQGDGACITGTWKRALVDVPALRAFAPQDVRLHKLAEQFQNAPGGASAVLKHRGSDVHDGCIQFELDGFTFAAQEEQFIDTARAFMRWVYNSLETAYQDSLSDEALKECAQDIEFTGNGEVY